MSCKYNKNSDVCGQAEEWVCAPCFSDSEGPTREDPVHPALGNNVRLFSVFMIPDNNEQGGFCHA